MDNQKKANNNPPSALTPDTGKTSNASMKKGDTALFLPCDDNGSGRDAQSVGTHRKSRSCLDIVQGHSNVQTGLDESSSTTQEDEDRVHRRSSNIKSDTSIEGLAAWELDAVGEIVLGDRQGDAWAQGYQGVALGQHEKAVVGGGVDHLDSIERVLEYADIDLLRLGQWQWHATSGCQVDTAGTAPEDCADKALEKYLDSLNDPLMLLSFPASLGLTTMMALFPAKQVWQHALARGEPIAMLTSPVGIGMIQRYPECLGQIPPALFGVAYTSGRDLGGTPLFYLTLPEAHWVLHCWGHLLPYVHPESLNRQIQRGPYATQTVINNLCVTETGIAWLSEHHDWIKMVQPATWQHVVEAAPYHGRSPLSFLESSLLGQQLIYAHGLHKKIRDEVDKPLMSTLPVTVTPLAYENSKHDADCVHQIKQATVWPGFFHIDMVLKAFSRLQECRQVIQEVLDVCRSSGSALLQLFCQGGYVTNQVPAAYRLVLNSKLDSSLFEVLSRSRFGQFILSQNQWVIDLIPKTICGGTTVSLDTSFVHNWLKGDHAIDFFKRRLNTWCDLPTEKWKQVVDQGEYEGLSMVFWTLQPKMHQWLPWVVGLSKKIRSPVLRSLGRKGMYAGRSALGALCMSADGMKWLRNYAHDMIPKINLEALMMPVCLDHRGVLSVWQCLESHVLGRDILKRWHAHWQPHLDVQQRCCMDMDHADGNVKYKQDDVRCSESEQQEQDCLDAQDDVVLAQKLQQHLIEEKTELKLNENWGEMLFALTMNNTKRGLRKRLNDKNDQDLEIKSMHPSVLSDVTMT